MNFDLVSVLSDLLYDQAPNSRGSNYAQIPVRGAGLIDQDRQYVFFKIGPINKSSHAKHSLVYRLAHWSIDRHTPHTDFRIKIMWERMLKVRTG